MQDTASVTEVRQKQRVIHLRPIIKTLDSRKTAALPVFRHLLELTTLAVLQGKEKLHTGKVFGMQITKCTGLFWYQQKTSEETLELSNLSASCI